MIVFISNFLNHHQLSICNELKKKDKFYFIASIPTSEEQLRLGYADMNNQYDFVVRMYESDEAKAFAQQLLDTAETVIAGSCAFPFDMIKPRLSADKLTFWFSERLFKISWLELFYPPKLKRVLSQCTKYRKNKNFYLLCAGGYVAADYKCYNAFKGKCFSWGYFPEFVEKNSDKLFCNADENKLKLVWAGRYLSWKRPEYAIYAAEQLKKNGIRFEMKMIGTGALYEKISKMIKKKHLDGYVKQIGALPYQQVRNEMDEADIFLFTSTRREGWGAVLNESMNSCCAVIAGKHIGAVKSMIKDGENGLLFNNKKQLKKALIYVVKDKEAIRSIVKAAYETVAFEWNAQIAAERFYRVAAALNGHFESPDFEHGPMKLIG